MKIARNAIVIGLLVSAFMLIMVASSHAESGLASWYGPQHHGRRTASGERFDQWAMTAAHRTLPLGSRARVCRNGRCIVVRINDRGPYIAGRIIDLSRAAAAALHMLGAGVARVTVQRE